jgi:sulfide:quinone oxidoreductase
MNNTGSRSPFRVVIAGGGVAALEAALALRELAGERVSTTILAPNAEFVYRPMVVREPFGYATARRYSLAKLAGEIGCELHADTFKWLDPAARTVHTGAGAELGYDALLLALGAHRYDRFPRALTLDDTRLDAQLHGLIQDLEGGHIHSVAFIAPSRMSWPLPIYELALMTAGRAYDMNIEATITVATPEDAPLAIFGSVVSEAIGAALRERGILTINPAHCEVHALGCVSIRPGPHELFADRIVALPELHGPSARGVPTDEGAGFIPVDLNCRVRRVDRVFAAGDATDFPIKHGGVAAQQADVAAEAIASLAGADVVPRRFVPEIHGMLLGLDKPMYLRAVVSGGHGVRSEISDEPLWSPATKIVATRLAPFLESQDRAIGAP